MRIGVFGGSFDPIHQGHLILAERCREEAKLDQVWFVPCSLSPHKQDGAHATDRQRIEMIELAISGHPAFLISSVELDRGGVSYMVETLQQIKEQQPNDELYLLMGDDSLETFDSWREPEKVCELATPLVVNRPGSGEVDLTVLKKFVEGSTFDQFKRSQVSSPWIDISSREIRHRVRSDKTIRYLMPRAVEKYIQTQNLYCPE
jgi:nicotinate-nucleotide adenylyltransferase